MNDCLNRPSVHRHGEYRVYTGTKVLKKSFVFLFFPYLLKQKKPPVKEAFFVYTVYYLRLFFDCSLNIFCCCFWASSKRAAKPDFLIGFFLFSFSFANSFSSLTVALMA